MRYSDDGRAASMHLLLYLYNCMMVLVLAIFMAITQNKIIQSMSASSFLAKSPVLPLPAGTLVLFTVLLVASLCACSYLYSRANGWRYTIFIAEVALCIILMRVINLSYDGVVLLLVADLMLRYEGRNQLILLLISMVAVYIIISYNIFLSYLNVVPFSLYLDYYSPAFQSMVLPIKNLAAYGNITIFVVFMVVLLQNKHQENEEIAKLNQQLVETNDKLHESNGSLHQANLELNNANTKLREYAATVASMTEIKERNRLAREIHDTIGHALTGIIAGLDACMMLVDLDANVAKQQMAKIRDAAQHGMTDVRRSMNKLRPKDLEKLPLDEALRKLVREFSEAGTTQVELSIQGLPNNLREDQEEVIYRVLQEGMTNASRHGHASEIKIVVTMEKSKLHINIADNGSGSSNIKPGFGLHHMKERLDMVGGSLQYWSDKGFTLDVFIPFSKSSEDGAL